MEVPRLKPEQFLFIREARGLTQEDFAVLLGTSQTVVSKWETGATVQSPRYFERMKKMLLLFSGDFQSPPPLQGSDIEIAKALNIRIIQILYVQNEIAHLSHLIEGCDQEDDALLLAYHDEIKAIRGATDWLIHFATNAAWWAKHQKVYTSVSGKVPTFDRWEAIVRWYKIGHDIPIYNPSVNKLYR